VTRSEFLGGRERRTGYPRSQLGRRCMSVFWQLVREKSLAPKCSGIRRNPPELLKDIFQNDICRFESYIPSQPVRSLRCGLCVWENTRHSGGLGRPLSLSKEAFAKSRTRKSEFRARVTGQQFSISVAQPWRLVRERTETGSSDRCPLLQNQCRDHKARSSLQCGTAPGREHPSRHRHSFLIVIHLYIFGAPNTNHFKCGRIATDSAMPIDIP
jgi:hypothetical protein